MTGRADRIFGWGWAALGLLIAAESWRMDRLEAQQINPWTVPGLVPGLLGLVMTGFGLVLALRRGAEAPTDGDGAEGWRIALALALCLGFGAGLVGHVPFWLGAALFVFLAILLFEWHDRRREGTLARGVLQAALVAFGSSAAISFLFQEVFLVRLP